jgi:uncharacterized protein YqgV (UPF0045/DUF77 family)
MAIEQTLQKEIEESKRWVHTAEGVYKRDLQKRIQLINWVLDNMKNPSSNSPICEIIECKMNEIIDKINRIHDAIEADPLDSQLTILKWIFYQVCSNEIKKFEKL